MTIPEDLPPKDTIIGCKSVKSLQYLFFCFSGTAFYMMVAGTRVKEHHRHRWSTDWLLPRHQVGRWFKAPHSASQVPLRHPTARVPSPSHSPLICDKRVIIPYLSLGSTKTECPGGACQSPGWGHHRMKGVKREGAPNPITHSAEPPEMVLAPTTFTVTDKHTASLSLCYFSWKYAP